MSSVLARVRGHEWWAPKLAPLLGSGYATAAFTDRPLLTSLLGVAGTFVAVLLAAVYVSVINDLTDREEDRRAGKPNRWADVSPARGWAMLGVVCAAAWGVAVLTFGHDGVALVVYAGVFLAFTLYSVPPVRAKARGLAGVLCDAAGAHVLPHLLIALVVFDRTERASDPAWIAALIGWSLGLGVRGALLHQIGDAAADRRVGVATFAVRRPAAATWLGRWAAPGVELIGLGVLLVLGDNPWAAALLVPYLWYERARGALPGQVAPVVVTPAPRARVLMQTFYVLVYPTTFLLVCASQHPLALVVLPVQLLLFPDELRCGCADLRVLLRGPGVGTRV